MQKHDITEILSSPRYMALFMFVYKLSRGNNNSVRRALLREALNESARKNVREKEKADLLIGIQKKIINFLQNILFTHLSGEKVVFEAIVFEEEYRYLLVKIFSENDYQSHNLESLVMQSFKKLDAVALTRRQIKKPPGKFQDIVDLMRSIIDDIGKEE